ncbi:hypothetical protein NCHU2750_38140 [Neorhizobium sp. NCHU2750]|nr:hypothetical protein NCHU2750_38140 [Neorhizobium sp. NCHU2750]
MTVNLWDIYVYGPWVLSLVALGILLYARYQNSK